MENNGNLDNPLRLSSRINSNYVLIPHELKITYDYINIIYYSIYEVIRMLTSQGLERDKAELTLGINIYDKPEDLVGIKAWTQLMLNLIFISPGTYPSMPELGVGIESYQYDFIDEALEEISAAITSQQQTYLPDIPLSSTSVTTMMVNGEKIMLIQLTFNTDEGPVSSGITLDLTPKKFLDFDIVW